MPESSFSHSHCHTLCVAGLARCAAVVLLTTSPLQAQPPSSESTNNGIQWSEPQDLLNGDLQSHWKHFSSVDKTPLLSVWQRVSNEDQSKTELICTRNPRGFLYTNRQFGEFDLNLEWRYVSDPNGNSGILIYTQADERLWPTSIQIQLHQPEAGSVFPSGDAVTDATVRKEGLARPVGEWNQCRIVSRSGRIVVNINGRKAAEITGCKPAKGCIAIQSEGSEVRFRRILIRTPSNSDEAPPDPKDDKADADNVEPAAAR